MIFITCILCCALVFFMGVKFGWKKLNCRCCRLLKGSRSTNTHVTTERQLSSCEDMITIHHHSPAFTLLSQSKIGEGNTRVQSPPHELPAGKNSIESVSSCHESELFCPKTQIAAANQVFYSSLNFSNSGRRRRGRRRTM
jgi:hypothetical protein